MESSSKRIFATVVICLVVIVVVGGMFLSGAPSRERARRLDMQRVSDLQSVASAIDQTFNSPTDGGSLPPSLDALRLRRDVYINSLTDPKTGEMYSYLITGPEAYQLCAVFETDGTEVTGPGVTKPMRIPAGGTDFWTHPIGQKCFDLKVQKYK